MLRASGTALSVIRPPRGSSEAERRLQSSEGGTRYVRWARRWALEMIDDVLQGTMYVNRVSVKDGILPCVGK